MEENREVLNPSQLSDMHDLSEALVDFIGESDNDMNVIMQALCRTIAYGGVHMAHYDEMTKAHFVAMVVESVSAHYENLRMAIALSRRGKLND